jgi:hypothetical membrane protein
MSQPPSAVTIRAANLAIAAIVLYQTLLAVLIVLRPDLDPSWHTISEWVFGPYGWLMTTAFFVSALAYLALFVALREEVRGRAGKVGRVFLAICAVGTIGVGLFETDSLAPPVVVTTTGILHTTFGGVALLLLPFAALLLNLDRARHHSASAGTRRTLLATGLLPFAGFLGFVLYTALVVVPLDSDYGPGVHIGWPPRVAFFTDAVWLVVLARTIVTRRRELEP